MLAYILSMRDIGKLHSTIGLIVEVLKRVILQIVLVLGCCSPLWIGFTIAFTILFDDVSHMGYSLYLTVNCMVLLLYTGSVSEGELPGPGGESDGHDDR